MKVRNIVSHFMVILIILSSTALFGQSKMDQKTDLKKKEKNDHLVIVWTSGDKEVALNMVYMYAFNARKYGWWNNITMIVWGPSAKLLSEDKELQDYVKKMKEKGIVFKACKACVDNYKVSETLSGIGVEVKYMGVELTDFIKDGSHIVTF